MATLTQLDGLLDALVEIVLREIEAGKGFLAHLEVPESQAKTANTVEKTRNVSDAN